MKQTRMSEFKPYMMLFIITLSILGVAGKPKCNPEKNEYYHRQAGVCLLCETCLKGEEPIPMEMWDAHWNPEVGPTECRRCRRCQPGMFSETRSFKCKPCKNCALYGQYESTPCSSVRDTICDGVKPTTISVNHTPTPKIKSDGQNDDNSKHLNSALYIVGFICVMIFLVLFLLMVGHYVKKKKFRKGRNDHSSVEEPKANSAECKSVRIDMPTEYINGDRQPLLSSTSDNLSVTTESVELDEIEHPGLPSPSTEAPQDLSTDGDCAFDHEPPANVRDKDPEHGTSDSGNSETTSTDDGTDSNTDQEGIGVDLVTDAATEKFSRKILFERQWSHPFDGRGEREYYSRASGAEAMPVVDRISKDDLSLVAKRRKKSQTVGENILRIASKYLVTNRLYLSVARDFELEEADIEIVNYDNKNESVQEVSYQMLLKILKKRRLTLDALKDAVEKHDQQAWENISSRLPA